MPQFDRDRYERCPEHESVESRDENGRKSRLQCNRPNGHAPPHRHYNRKAEIIVEWVSE